MVAFWLAGWWIGGDVDGMVWLLMVVDMRGCGGAGDRGCVGWYKDGESEEVVI